MTHTVHSHRFSVWTRHHSLPKAILTPGTFGIIVSKQKAFLPAHDGLFGHMWSGNCTRMRTQQAKQDHQEKVVVGHSRASLWSRCKSKQVNYRIQNKTRQSRIPATAGCWYTHADTLSPGLRADKKTYFMPSQALTCHWLSSWSMWNGPILTSQKKETWLQQQIDDPPVFAETKTIVSLNSSFSSSKLLMKFTDCVRSQ